MQNVTSEPQQPQEGEAVMSRRTAGWIGGAILAVLVVLGLVSGGTTQVTSGRALVIGDSLTEGSTDAIEAALTTAGWEPIVDGRGGWSVPLWREQAGRIAKFVQPDVAVVALGTNGCDDPCKPPGPGIDAIVRALLRAGAQEIYWVNVQEFPTYPRYAEYVNHEIERAVVKWPQVQLVDLDSFMEGHPEWHIEDNLHFNDFGAEKFAELIVQSLAT